MITFTVVWWPSHTLMYLKVLVKILCCRRWVWQCWWCRASHRSWVFRDDTQTGSRGRVIRGPCGAALAGAMKYLKKHDREGMVAVVILPDSAELFVEGLQWSMDGRERLYGCTSGPRYRSDLLHSKSKREWSLFHTIQQLYQRLKHWKAWFFTSACVWRRCTIGDFDRKSLLHHAIKGHAGQERWKSWWTWICVVHEDTELMAGMELFSRFETALVYEGKNRGY